MAIWTSLVLMLTLVKAGFPRQVGYVDGGVLGTSTSGTGVFGLSTNGVGVEAFSSTGTALLASTNSGLALNVQNQSGGEAAEISGGVNIGSSNAEALVVGCSSNGPDAIRVQSFVSGSAVQIFGGNPAIEIQQAQSGIFAIGDTGPAITADLEGSAPALQLKAATENGAPLSTMTSCRSISRAT